MSKYFSIFILALVFSTTSVVAQVTLFDSLHKSLVVVSSKPSEQLAYMDSLRANNCAPDYMLDMLQAYIHSDLGQYKLAVLYGGKAITYDSVRSNTQYFVDMSSLLASSYTGLREHDNASKYAIDVLEREALIAPDKRVEIVESMRFVLVLSYYRLGDTRAAFENFETCKKNLKANNNSKELAKLSFMMGEMTSVLDEEKQLDRAIELSLEREKIIAQIIKNGDAPPKYVDLQKTYLYAKLAYFYAANGDMKRAAQAYQEFSKTQASQNLYQQEFIIPYLIKAGFYERAISIQQAMLQSNRYDSLSMYNRMAMERLARCSEGLGDYRRATDYLSRALVIADSVSAREKRNESLEMNLIYQTQKRQQEIAQQKAQILNLRYALCILAIVVFAIVVVFVIVIYSLRMRKRKNEAIYKSLSSCKMSLSPLLGNSKADDNLFAKVAYVMSEQKLFLNPALTREELALAVASNTNYLSQAIREHTQMSTMSYVNSLRLDYVRMLIENSPKRLSNDYLAEKSGFGSTRTLLRQFGAAYELTPLEYFQLSHRRNITTEAAEAN